MTFENTASGPLQGTTQPSDAMTLWAEDTSQAGSIGLSVIRLDRNERLVIPFTTVLVRAAVHYLDHASLRSYVHCIGSGCLLCRLGRQVETRDLLPVYDAVNKVVCVLAISPNQRPQALRPQLMPVLRRLQDRNRLLVGLHKPDTTRFVVSSYELPEGADDGADVIREFVKKFEAGQVDLGSVFARLSNEELAAVPEISTTMAIRGIKLP